MLAQTIKLKMDFVVVSIFSYNHFDYFYASQMDQKSTVPANAVEGQRAYVSHSSAPLWSAMFPLCACALPGSFV